MPQFISAPAPLLNGSPADPYEALRRALGPTPDPPPDIAWQPPTDPLAGKTINPAIVHREVPIVSVATAWDVPQARSALNSLVLGLFDAPAQLADSVMGSDSRVQAAMASRLSILGRPVEFRVPRKYRDSAAAKECRDAFEEAWPSMATDAVLGEIERWGMMLGFGIAQILWDTSGEYAVPKPLPWHPRYTYYHWLYKTYVAITLDGQEPITPGDGSWILHAPYGAYRGWMRGAVRAITPWWLARSYALRDAARWSERLGNSILLAKAPAVGDPVAQARWRAQLANFGQEIVVHLPQNPPPALSYDIDLLESNGIGFDGFFQLIQQCNEEITLSLLAQTLTTSMPAEGGSSYAAARVHAGVLQGLMEADARAESVTVYRDIARPFAAINFGNPDLAPRVVRDVTPFEDAKTKALAAMQLAQTLNYLRIAGFRFDPKSVRKMFRETIPGFDPGFPEAIMPVQIEAQAARAGADVSAEGESDSGAKGADARGTIGRLMARFDPRAGKRARIATDADDIREAMAEIEAAAAERESRGWETVRRRRTA